ncbi:alpha/beta fold hydrolase [Acidisarcina polymorpha]|uniref:alpha/beta fold hydrolase n=1 Tax=Acidisarcina polymorpha TaxID=2211140 RepID=UPI001F312357|nr:alpha/beta hydrolase [Acidisarcina polymorpha]
MDQVRYKTQSVDGVNIFYREAGDPSRPTIVLLHGFPSSSHMFRDLIPELSGHYHIIAADMPGFGYSDQPPAERFDYTFDHIADVMDHFLDAVSVKKYSIYIQDYGSPIGFRLFLKHPDRIQAMVTQNGNAYEEGLSPFWSESIIPYWEDKSPANEKRVRDLLTFEVTKFQYTKGFSHPEYVSPDSYTFDQMTLDRPGNDVIQLALFYDYQNNVKQYSLWHDALRKNKPPVLAVWGKNDPIFLPAGAEAFKRDVPAAEIYFVDSGHFALEEASRTIADYILAFLAKNVK